MIGVLPGPEKVHGEDALRDQVVRGEAAGLEQDAGARAAVAGGGDVGEGTVVVARRRRGRGAVGAAPLRLGRAALVARRGRRRRAAAVSSSTSCWSSSSSRGWVAATNARPRMHGGTGEACVWLALSNPALLVVVAPPIDKGKSGVRPFSDVRWESDEAQIRGERVRSRSPAAAAAARWLAATRVCFGAVAMGGPTRQAVATPAIRQEEERRERLASPP